MKSQGAELYYIDPDSSQVVVVGCITEVTGIDSTIEQNEVTCLSDLARRYEAGLATPGRAQFGIYFDPKDPSHLRLHELKKAGETLKWVLGMSEDTGTDPTVGTDGDFELPDTRSWVRFDGFMNAFPIDHAQNTPVRSQIGIQMSGDATVVAATVST